MIKSSPVTRVYISSMHLVNLDLDPTRDAVDAPVGSTACNGYLLHATRAEERDSGREKASEDKHAAEARPSSKHVSFNLWRSGLERER